MKSYICEVKLIFINKYLLLLILRLSLSDIQTAGYANNIMTILWEDPLIQPIQFPQVLKRSRGCRGGDWNGRDLY